MNNLPASMYFKYCNEKVNLVCNKCLKKVDKKNLSTINEWYFRLFDHDYPRNKIELYPLDPVHPRNKNIKNERICIDCFNIYFT